MRKLILIILTVACLLLSPLASTLPDGLETVLHQQKLSEQMEDSSWAIMADYNVGFVQNSTIQGLLAGASGIVIIIGISISLMWLIRKKEIRAKVANQ